MCSLFLLAWDHCLENCHLVLNAFGRWKAILRPVIPASRLLYEASYSSNKLTRRCLCIQCKFQEQSQSAWHGLSQKADQSPGKAPQETENKSTVTKLLYYFSFSFFLSNLIFKRSTSSTASTGISEDVSPQLADQQLTQDSAVSVISYNLDTREIWMYTRELALLILVLLLGLCQLHQIMLRPPSQTKQW